jgi:hypothetical protein
MALLGAACTPGTATTPTNRVPLAAGRNPSTISTMVCTNDAGQKMNAALGEQATISTPTWVGHLYSCQYVYSTGSMLLSVKEMSSWAQTDDYFQMLANQMGKVRNLRGLGQGAFQTTNGSIVVRKDWKVLLVDIAGLPAQFGMPATSAGDVAVTVGDVILGCWAGD